MRNKYRITRGGDGRLLVKPSDTRNPRQWSIGLLVICVAVLLMASDVIPISKAFFAVVEMSQFFSKDNSAPTSRTIVVKLNLSDEGMTSLSTLTDGDGEAAPRVAESITLSNKGHSLDTTQSSAQAPLSSEIETTQVNQAVDVGLPSDTHKVEETPELAVREVTVRSGDSLYTIFNDLGIAQGELIEITKGEGKQLKRIHPGQVLIFHLGENKALQKLIYKIDETHSNHFIKSETKYEVESVEVPLERRQTFAQGKIDSSLFMAGQAAGLPDKTTMELAEIFGWDVDFALDIRRGDRFTIIYEELFTNGRKVRNGAILAAEFVNQGRVIRAVRYTDKAGYSHYYTPEGDSMRKAFLRTPVEFSRISSHFGKRKHPILSTVRNHNGVDYAARTGTPIKATGDGRVEFAGRKGGYGKTIVVRHGNVYTTLYAHMSKFAKGIKTGKSVQQGQVIGYVGSTGLATGPHLHYEFRVRGVHRNPLKVELPKAASIASESIQDFRNQTRSLALELSGLANTHVASND